MRTLENFLHIKRQSTPGGTLGVGQLLYPRHKLRVFETLGHFQTAFDLVLNAVKRIVGVEGFRSEEHLDETDEYLAVVLVVYLAAVKVLDENSPEGIPRDFVDVDVVTGAHAIDVLVDQVQGASLVGFVELIDLGPSDRDVP